MTGNSKRSCFFQRDAGWCEASEALSGTHPRAAAPNGSDDYYPATE